MNEEQPLAPALVREFVTVAHGDAGRVRAMLADEPNLLHAAWNWTEGDWETALGVAAHVGHREIATLLLERGARMDIFAAAMLDHVETVRAIVTAQPSAAVAPGPHGIPLIAHAQAGGARNVLDFLNSIEVTR